MTDRKNLHVWQVAFEFSYLEGFEHDQLPWKFKETTAVMALEHGTIAEIEQALGVLLTNDHQRFSRLVSATWLGRTYN